MQLLEAHLDAGLIDIAQVDQFRQSIETERANLLQSRNGLQNQFEGFKTGTLGLPPDLPIVLDESLIKPFQFLNPEIAKIQADLSTLIDTFGELETLPTVDALQKTLQQQQALRLRIDERMLDVRQEIERLEAATPVRFETMTPTEQRMLKLDIQQLVDNLDQITKNFEQTGATLTALEKGLSEPNRQATVPAIIAANVEMASLLGELTLVEARARLETISVEKIKLSSTDALEIARTNRLDWMNNRAALVDTWRLIEFNGNRLESNLDVVLNGEMGTVGDNAVKFRARDTTMSAGLRFDTPFNRRVERNDFRQQLIFYQQARRQMIQYEDGVNRGLRTLLRELEQLRINLEIQRRAVAISIRRVDQTRENFNKPTPPPEPGQKITQFGPTAALNLLTALSDLRSSQNNFMSVWLNYQAGRMRLLRDLGIIQIDDDGVWIEQSVQEAVNAAIAEVPVEMPPDVPHQWYETLDNLPQSDDVESNGEASNNSLDIEGRRAAPGSSADVARAGNENLNTANAGLVERLLGTRFASIFAGQQNTRTSKIKSVTAARHRTSTSKQERRLQENQNKAATPAVAEFESQARQQSRQNSDSTVTQSSTRNIQSQSFSRGQQVRVPLSIGPIRPVSFKSPAPSATSAPVASSENSTSQKRASLNTDNAHPVRPENKSKQPVQLIRSSGGWKTTRK